MFVYTNMFCLWLQGHSLFPDELQTILVLYSGRYSIWVGRLNLNLHTPKMKSIKLKTMSLIEVTITERYWPAGWNQALPQQHTSSSLQYLPAQTCITTLNVTTLLNTIHITTYMTKMWRYTEMLVVSHKVWYCKS